MIPIKYKKLAFYKNFPRKVFEGITELEFFQLREKFIHEYEHNSIGEEPDYNLLELVRFDTRMGPFDLYAYDYFNSSIIISNRLLKILKEYNLQEHKVFPRIRYTFKGEQRDDMNFLIFYKDYEQFVDYGKSTYQQVVSDYTFQKDEKGNLKKEAILKDNLKFKSKEQFQFEARKRKPLSDDPNIVFKHVFCPECIRLDMFFFNTYNKGIYLSPSLVERLANEKIKGVDYWGHFTFDFIG